MIANQQLLWRPVKSRRCYMTTTNRKSRILDEMHQTARGLHGAGLISKRRMAVDGPSSFRVEV